MGDNFLIYRPDDEDVIVNVRFDTDNETVWLTQNQMADLFSTLQNRI